MEAEKFRKKPVEIEAMQVFPHTLVSVAQWMIENDGHFEPGLMGLTILTLEGNMLARHGDWIIKGGKGEFYPCKPDIFEETYERA